MNRSENINELAAALAKTQLSLGNIPKTKTAKVRMKAGGEYSYKYADFADVVEALRKPLASNGLSYTQTLQSKEGFSLLVTTLMHSSGQWISSEYDLPLVGGEVTPQVFGSHFTYGKRYSLCGITGLAADEDDDGAVATEHKSEPKPQPKPKQEIPNVAGLGALATQRGWTTSEAKNYMQTAFGVDSTSRLRSDQIVKFKEVLTKFRFNEAIDRLAIESGAAQ